MQANVKYFIVEGGNSTSFKPVASLICHPGFQNHPILNGSLEYDSANICIGRGNGASAGPLHFFPY